ncbi:MAG: heparan-alpha-glucosaminide N-acetyltransferase [Desulfitobacteriaceae bacterium]
MAAGNLDSYMRTRIHELDLIKTLAIVLMVVYHLIYDLKEFANFPIDYHALFWHTLQKTSALLFIFVSGVSSGLSRNPLRQGLKIFSYGLIITAITYLVMPEQYVRFGILHFLGVATLILFFLRKQKIPVLIILAILSATIGFTLNKLYLPTPLLLPIGVKYPEFGSVDYFPIFPYLSVSILGLIAYRLFYMKARRENPGFLQPRRTFLPISLSSSLSKHSLMIYLVHQPLLLGAIFTFLALAR